MAIIFSKHFEQLIENKHGITKKVVLDAIGNNLRFQKPPLKGGVVELYTAQMKDSHDYLIVWSHAQGHNLMVDSAFRIRQELVDEVKTLEPLGLFRAFIGIVGLPMKLTGEAERFYFSQLIPIESLDQNYVMQWIKEHAQPVDRVPHIIYSQGLLQAITENGRNYLECAGTFCVDMDVYSDWIARKQ